ncbi:hypothetical protein C5167_035527 [Papaver somniferum]|uniref:Uncharacterized protein n=1 Tax=Papaver somniferum TaxID=3469 RepID=A0A4Y7KG52_PAPSO|nr:hypothetical protein C5167_035527 [Papaver somniferum]
MGVNNPRMCTSINENLHVQGNEIVEMSILCCTRVAWRLEESLVIYLAQDSNIMWIVQAYGRLVYHREGLAAAMPLLYGDGLGNAYPDILAKHGDGAISSPPPTSDDTSCNEGRHRCSPHWSLMLAFLGRQRHLLAYCFHELFEHIASILLEPESNYAFDFDSLLYSRRTWFTENMVRSKKTPAKKK